MQQGNFTVDTYASLLGVQASCATKAIFRTARGTDVQTSKKNALRLIRDGASFALESAPEGWTRKVRNGDEGPEDRAVIVVLED